MKILIAYYSRTGVIKKLKEKIKKNLEGDDQIDVEEIKTKKKHTFIVWVFKKIFKQKCRIEELKIKNISEYDLIYIGSPSWLGVPLPIRNYIQKIEGMENKNIILFGGSYFPLLLEKILGFTFLLKQGIDNLIDNKGGKVLDNIIISGFLYKNGWLEERVGNKIEGFLGRVKIDISSIKEYYFKKRETKTAYLVLGFISFLLSFFFVFQIIAIFLGWDFLTWEQFSPIFIYSFFLFLIMIATIKIKEALPLIKYIASWTLVSMTAIILIFLDISTPKSFLIFPFLFILLIMAFFKAHGTIIFTGILSVVFYLALAFYSYEISFITNIIGISSIALTTIILIAFIKRENQKFKNIIKITEGLKQEKDILSIKVKARTRQLKEQAERLEAENKKKTEKLKEKLDEMKRFQRLTIGRELKMKELKEKIEKLKKKLKEYES